MNMRKLLLIVALLGAFGVVVGGLSCSRRGSSEDQLTICFGFQDLETEFWVAGHKAITETLRAKGIRVLERNANQDANRQLEQIRDAIAQEVNGIIIIPQDGESAVTIVGEANRAGIPIAVFNRPPSDRSNPALVIVADNEKIADEAVAYMAKVAREKGKGRKWKPLIVVGDLGDRNAVARRKGFFNVMERNPDLFETPIEVPSKWDPATTLANLEAALQANPDVDFLFTSSDFLYPQIKAVLEPLGKWKKIDEPGHVILGGLDGDSTAYTLMKEGYVDATGVQDLFFEANTIMEALLTAIEVGQKTPENWMEDPGFALTQENMAERADEMWGYRVLHDE
ncbi:MAG: sugar ABC transporter substrate-binding protein [Sedimentisphaerales bacterium]|jgi:inositol transport system substrate-binding protein|nr:sugar ABC transporter substrate-binding protein [Sedimentisphaerales bacterium]HNY78962.1 sugar ABC transporter substrate-binding protein [Sedimentisphaerales bacterium]HOC62622.1 sugar ABC transporter substrate-binding protein [Sedimentisphaerales bacterium]HOH64820.1 sugar ABC transporter substrate-binding protein [Sedimentisphaerales bacterium]HPY50533.1 sugar ABC transporter substrate-binding protein [Sedimentisphaerales bacterium]